MLVILVQTEDAGPPTIYCLYAGCLPSSLPGRTVDVFQPVQEPFGPQAPTMGIPPPQGGAMPVDEMLELVAR